MICVGAADGDAAVALAAGERLRSVRAAAAPAAAAAGPPVTVAANASVRFFTFDWLTCVSAL